jgi:putative ABC transport system permease protein
MRYWELLRLAMGGIRRTPLRMTLTVLGVAIATALWVSLVGFCLGVQQRIEEPFLRLELYNRLNVFPKQPATSSVELHHDPERMKPPVPAPVLDDEAIARISRIPGVGVAYPDLSLSDVQILVEGKPVLPPDKSTWALGLPRESGRLHYVHESVSAGKFFSPKKGVNEAILGWDLAKKLGYEKPGDAVGKKLTLEVKGEVPAGPRKFEVVHREIEVQVVGVWDPVRGAQFFSTDRLLLPVDLIRELPGALTPSSLDLRKNDPPERPPGYKRAVVRVERPGDLFEVEERIRALGFETRNNLSQIKQMREFFILMDLVWGAVGAVALLVAGLGIINTMLMAVLERYREIGTYKALGASDGDVRLMFLTEAGLVGLLGGVFGLILGRVLSWLCQIGFNAFARSKGIEEPMASHFPLHLMLGALAFALVVSLISGVYPASRAAKVDPIKALRSE